MARKAAEVYPNVELVIIPAGNHGFFKEHDKIALEAVEMFVEVQNDCNDLGTEHQVSICRDKIESR